MALRLETASKSLKQSKPLKEKADIAELSLVLAGYMIYAGEKAASPEGKSDGEKGPC